MANQRQRRPGPTKPVPDGRNLRLVLCAIGLAAAVIGLYSAVSSHEFLNFDDDRYVTGNDHVKAGVTFDGLRWAFSDVATTGNWHPVTWMSHMLDVQLFQMNAGAHLIENAVWHALNSVLLLMLIWNLTGKLWRSAIVSSLWALHPLRVESVAWVSERKDVLGAFFYLATLLAYRWYADRTTWRRYAAVAGLMALGLMSKPTVVTAPFVMLLLDYWPLKRKESWGALIREKIPLFALIAGESVITFVVQKNSGAVWLVRNLDFGERLANALVAYVRYLAKIFFPHPLAALYPYERAIPAWMVAASVAILVAITLVAWTRRRENPYLIVGWLWFLGTLVPMIGLVQVGWQAIADRYSYIPSIGLLIALVWMIAGITEKHAWTRYAVWLVLLALAWSTSSQIPYWHDDMTLFEHAVAVTGPNPFAQYHIGIDLLRMHRTHEALPHLEMVTGIAPGFYGGYFTLGKAQASDGKTEAAVASFTKAIDLKPDYADARYCRALVLVDEGDLRNAEADLRTALRLGLDREFSAAAHNVLGMIGEQKGELNGAIGEFEQAISLNPSLAFAHRNLAITLLREGREAEAIERLKQAIAATQGDPSLTQMFEELEKGRGRP